MLNRLWAIAANTFVETIRQPIFGVILLATALMLILNVSLAAFTLGEDNKLLLDLGLNTLLLSGLFLASFSASGVLSREIENKTVLTVISKPIPRPLFILGKYLGLLGALSLAFYLSFLVFVLTQRHGVLENSSDPWDQPVLALGVGALIVAKMVAVFANYFYGMDYTALMFKLLTPLLTLAVIVIGFLDKDWTTIPFGSNFVGGQVVIACILVFLVIVFTAAVALAASTRMGQLMTLACCLAIVALGVISDHAIGQHAIDDPNMTMFGFLKLAFQDFGAFLATAAYHIIPNVGAFWVTDGLFADSYKTTVTFQYLGYATTYSLLITVAALAVAVTLFQQREVG